MYKPNIISKPNHDDNFRVKAPQLITSLIEENSKASDEILIHCKLLADQQAIIADLLNRVKLLEEDKIKKSCC